MVTYQFDQHKEKKIITIIFSYRKNWEEGKKNCRRQNGALPYLNTNDKWKVIF